MGIPGDVLKFHQMMSEVTETICPGALSVNLSRIDTKDKHRYHSLYEADSINFRTSRHRAFIREARTGEWDYSPSNSVSTETYPALELQKVTMPNEALKDVWEHIPRLWVLVACKLKIVRHCSISSPMSDGWSSAPHSITSRRPESRDLLCSVAKVFPMH